MKARNSPPTLQVVESPTQTAPASPEVHVELAGVTRYFAKNDSKELFHALGPIDLTLTRGEFFSVVGPSGCGKSTLLDALAGLAKPSSGTVTFEGQPVKGVPDGVGVVFQEDASFPWLNLRDNISFGLRMAGVDGAEIRRRVDYAMGFMGLKDYLKFCNNLFSEVVKIIIWWVFFFWWINLRLISYFCFTFNPMFGG